MGSNYKCFDIKLAGITITGEFSYDDTAKKFGAYCIGPSSEAAGIRVPAFELDLWKKEGLEPGAQFEFSCFTAVASEALSAYNRIVVHAVAFAYAGGAYLISAPSGEGKSTMIRALMDQYPGEFSVICGDRPILSFEGNGAITVYPSPWNGKENWYGAKEAPLRGIFFLKREDQNRLISLQKKEAITNTYSLLIQTRDTEEIIHRFAGFTATILESVPTWRLYSHEARDSAPLLYAELRKAEEKHEV